MPFTFDIAYLPLLTTLIAGGGALWGIKFNQDRTDARERAKDMEARRISFLKQQLDEFYSPILGLAAALYLWQRQYRLAMEVTDKMVEEDNSRKVEESEKYAVQFKQRVASSNRPYILEQGPTMLKEIITIFQAKFGFAEPSTRKHLAELLHTLAMWSVWVEDVQTTVLLDKETWEPSEDFGAFLRDLKFHTEKIAAEIKASPLDTKESGDDFQLASRWLTNDYSPVIPATAEMIESNHTQAVATFPPAISDKSSDK